MKVTVEATALGVIPVVVPAGTREGIAYYNIVTLNRRLQWTSRNTNSMTLEEARKAVRKTRRLHKKIAAGRKVGG